MSYKSYEQIIARDRPSYWWRPVRSSAESQGTPGLAATLSDVGTGANVSYGGHGLPGATQAVSTHTVGTSNSHTTNPQGYATGAHTLPGNVTAGITIEVWCMWTATVVATRTYNVFGRRNTSNGIYVGFFMYEDNIQLTLGGNYTNSFADYDQKVNQGRWLHAVGIIKTNGSEFYVNGRRVRNVGSGTPEGTVSDPTGSVTTSLGQSSGNNGSRYSFPGFLAEPAIYPYALSPSQIIDHYNAGLRPYVGAVDRSFYPFTVPSGGGGLTAIGDLTNKRVALVSDRPR